MPLPNLLIIGGHKCGSTTLHTLLDQHPEISMSKTKELNYFVDHLNWGKPLEWYESQFESNPIIGESSVMYTRSRKDDSNIAQRIHSTLPDAKLIYVVRDPIDRIASHYVDSVSALRETRTFEAVVDAIVAGEDREYLPTSRYWFQLSKYLQYFPTDQIHLVFLEDLRHDVPRVARRSFEFLDVNAHYPMKDTIHHNRSAVKRHPNAVLAKSLPSRLKKQMHFPTWLPGKASRGMKKTASMDRSSDRTPSVGREYNAATDERTGVGCEPSNGLARQCAAELEKVRSIT